jgi:hypothetical protein
MHETWIKVGMHVMPMDWDCDDQEQEIAREKIGAGPILVDVRWFDQDDAFRVRLNYDNWEIFNGVDFSELGCDANDFWFHEDEVQNYAE